MESRSDQTKRRFIASDFQILKLRRLKTASSVFLLLQAVKLRINPRLDACEWAESATSCYDDYYLQQFGSSKGNLCSKILAEVVNIAPWCDH
jgi:hypothetical protein